jgi:hypothetical protein
MNNKHLIFPYDTGETDVPEDTDNTEDSEDSSETDDPEETDNTEDH